MSPTRAPARPPPGPFPVEFDTFRVAVGFAIIAGALGVVLPYLDSLAGALAALAAAGWAAGHARERSAGGRWFGPAEAVGLGAVALGALAFFLLPGSFALARGLVLGLSWLPMWWFERPVPLRTRPIEEAG